MVFVVVSCGVRGGVGGYVRGVGGGDGVNMDVDYGGVVGVGCCDVGCVYVVGVAVVGDCIGVGDGVGVVVGGDNVSESVGMCEVVVEDGVAGRMW